MFVQYCCTVPYNGYRDPFYLMLFEIESVNEVAETIAEITPFDIADVPLTLASGAAIIFILSN